MTGASLIKSVAMNGDPTGVLGVNDRRLDENRTKFCRGGIYADLINYRPPAASIKVPVT